MFTLYNQKSYGNTKMVVRSESLLKLLKIEFMCTYSRGFSMGHTFIVDESNNTYSVLDLDANEYWNFRHFEEKVSNGSWFKSYDYLNRF